MSDPRFWHGKTALITGGLGFIGARIGDAIRQQSGRVIVADRAAATTTAARSATPRGEEPILRGGDITDLSWIAALVEECRPDFLFHLAGQSIVEECNGNPVAAFESNIAGTWNVLEACRRIGSVKGVIVASSYKVYGQQDDVCFAEDAPLLGLQPYDAAKVCADVLARSYHASFGVPVAVTRCANTYGEGDRHLSRIVPAVVHAAIRDEELIIRSDGRAERDYLYVADAVTGYLAIAEGLHDGGARGHAFNLGSGTPISVLGVVEAVSRLLDQEVRYRVLLQPRKGVDRMYLDISKAKRLLDWEPRASLASGLLRTIAWHREELRQQTSANSPDLV